MKKILVIICLILVFIGCKCPQAVTKTEYVDTVIYKERFDSLDVPVFVPASGLNLKHKLPPGIPINYKAEGSVKKDNKKASYKIDSGAITIDCDEEAHMDTIKNLRIKVYDLERRINEKTTITVEKEVIDYKTPNWVKWLIGVEVIIVVIIGFIKGWWKGPISWIKKIVQGLIKLFI